MSWRTKFYSLTMWQPEKNKQNNSKTESKKQKNKTKNQKLKNQKKKKQQKPTPVTRNMQPFFPYLIFCFRLPDFLTP